MSVTEKSSESRAYENGTYKALTTVPIFSGADAKEQKKMSETSSSFRSNHRTGIGDQFASYRQDELFSVTEIIEKSGMIYGKTPSGYVRIADKKKEFCAIQ